MALNPIVFTEKVVRSFLRYQLTAYRRPGFWSGRPEAGDGCRQNRPKKRPPTRTGKALKRQVRENLRIQNRPKK